MEVMEDASDLKRIMSNPVVDAGMAFRYGRDGLRHYNKINECVKKINDNKKKFKIALDSSDFVAAEKCILNMKSLVNKVATEMDILKNDPIAFASAASRVCQIPTLIGSVTGILVPILLGKGTKQNLDIIKNNRKNVKQITNDTNLMIKNTKTAEEALKLKEDLAKFKKENKDLILPTKFQTAKTIGAGAAIGGAIGYGVSVSTFTTRMQARVSIILKNTLVEIDSMYKQLKAAMKRKVTPNF